MTPVGPLRVCVLESVSVAPLGGPSVPIGPLQQKILLTLVVAAGSRSVSLDRIAEELWGDHRPRHWLAAIRTLANSLRRAAGDHDLIHWTGRGYRLHRHVGAVETDVERMLQHAAKARVALDEHRFRDAEREAREALACYGGGPWTSDLWSWGDFAADAYCVLGRALLAQHQYLRCILELGRASEALDWHGGLQWCLSTARQAVATAV
jgi:DNA-binding SARP family transcriptional activator